MKPKDANASKHIDSETCANVILGLVKQTRYGLIPQLWSLEGAFVEQGGLRKSTNCTRLTPFVSASDKSLTSQHNETPHY